MKEIRNYFWERKLKKNIKLPRRKENSPQLMPHGAWGWKKRRKERNKRKRKYWLSGSKTKKRRMRKRRNV